MRERRPGVWEIRVAAGTDPGDGTNVAAVLAQAIGLEASAARGVAVDDAHRLDVAALARMVTQDRSARRAPFLVVATAGTTSGGAIDPLAALAALTIEHGLHLCGRFASQRGRAGRDQEVSGGCPKTWVDEGRRLSSMTGSG